MEIIIVLTLYLVPSIIAMTRGIPSVGGVIVVNLFLGWTFLGWVVALAWACSGSTSGQGKHEH